MPFLICETHGGAPCPLTCSHIADQVRQRQTIDPFYVWANYIGSAAWGVVLCLECAKQHGYSERRTKLDGDGGLDQIFAIEDQVPVCATCFRECCPEDRRLDWISGNPISN